MGNRRSFSMILTVLLVVIGAVPAQAAERQLLYYNHAWGTLDRATADAIEHSSYLREFADFEVRTTTGADGKVWTGRYLRGKETYLEIFGVGDVGGQDGELGAAGLGLSTERDGDIETVKSRLVASGQTPMEFLQTRDFGDHKPVPWFDVLYLAEQYDRFGAWAMEYRDEYFADPRSQTGPARFPGDVSRERYLPDRYKNKLMRDVSLIRIAVTARDLAATTPLLRAGGFSVRTEPGGVVATRGGTTIRFDEVAMGRTGLKRVEFALNRAVPPHVQALGASTLVVGPGAHAVWTF
ncbi:DUF5829 family protein [Lentzea flava]|uniref:Uncharacterized protein n=1 Tax=Lentzea flava TaxID=103732 RepID=A0ABQ2UFP2_9PSEU|nr:DUF5829 family protein [Lentzea flava]MCP2197935.1 hypothetical protein [Lentzea flava]GGU23492.1 hypothetical protein GCM10010178_14550 [Lentzea flava]